MRRKKSFSGIDSKKWQNGKKYIERVDKEKKSHDVGKIVQKKNYKEMIIFKKEEKNVSLMEKRKKNGSW